MSTGGHAPFVDAKGHSRCSTSASPARVIAAITLLLDRWTRRTPSSISWTRSGKYLPDFLHGRSPSKL